MACLPARSVSAVDSADALCVSFVGYYSRLRQIKRHRLTKEQESIFDETVLSSAATARLNEPNPLVGARYRLGG